MKKERIVSYSKIVRCRFVARRKLYDPRGNVVIL